MNETIASLLANINDHCSKLSVFYLTGGIIPYYFSDKKNGNVPVADIYIFEDDIEKLYNGLNEDPPSDIEVKCYETELGTAIDYCNTDTTFIDFSSTQLQQSFGFHVSILPLRNTAQGIMFSNSNREDVCICYDILRNIKEADHQGVRIRIPEDETTYKDTLYRDKDAISVREYTYGNCIMSESAGYRYMLVDIIDILNKTSELKSDLNKNLIAFKREKEYCDKIFDELRSLFV